MLRSTHPFRRLVVGAFALIAVVRNISAQQGNDQTLVFQGKILNDLGESVEGAQVQFWQTDINGNYNHPDFTPVGPLLDDFQYFGTATTQENGVFDFITVRPGLYSQRPIAHIHYRVWYQGQLLLTSQFYFRDDGNTQPELLQLDVVPDVNGTMTTSKTVVVNLGLGGSQTLTPSQTSGPFYPAVDFFGFDSDMTTVPANEEGTSAPVGSVTTLQPSTMSSEFPTTIVPETATTAPTASPVAETTTTSPSFAPTMVLTATDSPSDESEPTSSSFQTPSRKSVWNGVVGTFLWAIYTHVL